MVVSTVILKHPHYRFLIFSWMTDNGFAFHICHLQNSVAFSPYSVNNFPFQVLQFFFLIISCDQSARLRTHVLCMIMTRYTGFLTETCFYISTWPIICRFFNFWIVQGMVSWAPKRRGWCSSVELYLEPYTLIDSLSVLTLKWSWVPLSLSTSEFLMNQEMLVICLRIILGSAREKVFINKSTFSQFPLPGLQGSYLQ